MSTKTLRKRIALVAVAALGAGVLSVAPANADSDISDLSTGSVGLLGVSANLTGLTGTATLLSTGTLAVTADTGYYAVSSGAVITGFLGTKGDDDVIDSDQAGVTLDDTASGFTVKPTGAAG